MFEVGRGAEQREMMIGSIGEGLLGGALGDEFREEGGRHGAPQMQVELGFRFGQELLAERPGCHGRWREATTGSVMMARGAAAGSSP